MMDKSSSLMDSSCPSLINLKRFSLSKKLLLGVLFIICPTFPKSESHLLHSKLLLTYISTNVKDPSISFLASSSDQQGHIVEQNNSPVEQRGGAGQVVILFPPLKRKFTEKTHQLQDQLNSVSSEAFRGEREFFDDFKPKKKLERPVVNRLHRKKWSSLGTDQKNMQRPKFSNWMNPEGLQASQIPDLVSRVKRQAEDENEVRPSSDRKQNIMNRSGEKRAVIDVNKRLRLKHPFSMMTEERYDLEKRERELLEQQLWLEKIMARRKEEANL